MPEHPGSNLRDRQRGNDREDSPFGCWRGRLEQSESSDSSKSRQGSNETWRPGQNLRGDSDRRLLQPWLRNPIPCLLDWDEPQLPRKLQSETRGWCRFEVSPDPVRNSRLEPGSQTPGQMSPLS